MAEPGPKIKLGAEPAKLMIAGVLAVVLVVVLAVQFQGERRPRFKTKRRVVRSATSNRMTVEPAESPQQQELTGREPRTWPEFSLEAVLRHDPFQPAGELVGLLASGRTADSAKLRRQQQREQAAALLRREGVRMIFQDHQGPAAAVGDRILREGDAFDGFRVVKIGPEGIVLSDSESPETTRKEGTQ